MKNLWYLIWEILIHNYIISESRLTSKRWTIRHFLDLIRLALTIIGESLKISWQYVFGSSVWSLNIDLTRLNDFYEILSMQGWGNFPTRHSLVNMTSLTRWTSSLLYNGTIVRQRMSTRHRKVLNLFDLNKLKPSGIDRSN